METFSDENGIATFENVEPGGHKIKIAYEDNVGEMNINLTGDTKEFQYNITVEPKNNLLKYVVIALSATILTSVFFIVLIKYKKGLTYQ